MAVRLPELLLTHLLSLSSHLIECLTSLSLCSTQDADIGDLFFDDAQFEALEKDFDNVRANANRTEPREKKLLPRLALSRHAVPPCRRAASPQLLQELGQNPVLERFRLEYETLYRALKKSHESEKRLVKKCRELSTDIGGTQQKLISTAKLAENDKADIAALKTDILRMCARAAPPVPPPPPPTVRVARRACAARRRSSRR